MAQYQYSLRLPVSVAAGAHRLQASVDGFDLPDVPIEIEPKMQPETRNAKRNLIP
jgi:hypothetical protein